MKTPDRPYLVDKPLGATPLEALGLLREALPELAQEKLSYGGRLDPMATGLLLALSGEQLARQEEYWNLGKEYEAQVILGIATDSYDLLGLVDIGPTPEITPERILAAAAGLVGKLSVPVPAFSSAQVSGKPLFAWVRDGVPMPAPVRRMVVNEIQVHDIATVDAATLAQTLGERIPLVRGDFRQDVIHERWRALPEHGNWPMVRLTVRCGSGTYIRSLAHELGRRLGTGGVLADLRRTRVGPWSINDPGVIRPSWPR